MGFGLCTIAIQMYNTILVLILWQHTSSMEAAHILLKLYYFLAVHMPRHDMCITLFLLMWLYEIKAVSSLFSPLDIVHYAAAAFFALALGLVNYASI